MLIDALSRLTWERLDRAEYFTDYLRKREASSADSIKLEVAQVFREPGDRSFDAFECGDLASSQEAMQDKRDAARKEFSRLALRRIAVKRIRVVETPLTPYLEWELQVLLHRAEMGEDIRVAPELPGGFSGAEIPNPPELLAIGTEVLWRVLYEPNGGSIGAYRAMPDSLLKEIYEEVDSFHGESQELAEWVHEHHDAFLLQWPSRSFTSLGR